VLATLACAHVFSLIRPLTYQGAHSTILLPPGLEKPQGRRGAGSFVKF
jgi:hypothetical protein